MQDYGAMIRSTFELGSVRDAQLLFEACIKNAFPTFHFRRLELIRFIREVNFIKATLPEVFPEVFPTATPSNLLWR